MSELHLVEIRPDLRALLSFLRSQGLQEGDRDEDLGYGVHAWLTAAFGRIAPKPWRLFWGERTRHPRILGYSCGEAATLRQVMLEFATPGAFSVCPNAEEVNSRPIPSWQTGRTLGFELVCCPIGREARTGVEKDLFLIESGRSTAEKIGRDEVYCAWVRRNLQQSGASQVLAARMEGFRLVRLLRQSRAPGTRPLRHYLKRPQVLVRGELTIANPVGFTELLRRGVGRHKAFGYGMLLLRPLS